MDVLTCKQIDEVQKKFFFFKYMSWFPERITFYYPHVEIYGWLKDIFWTDVQIFPSLITPRVWRGLNIASEIPIVEELGEHEEG